MVYFKIKKQKLLCGLALALLPLGLFSTGALEAETGDVAGAIGEHGQTHPAKSKPWSTMLSFAALTSSLPFFFFAKLGMAYFDYRKHGQFGWSGPAILFACLVFTLTFPLYT